jgi:hypothetical protein
MRGVVLGKPVAQNLFGGFNQMKKVMVSVLILAIVAMCGMITTTAVFAAPTVIQAVTCHNVVDKNPEGPSNEFVPGKMFCWAKFDALENTNVTFVWYCNGVAQLKPFTTEVKASHSYRTWAYRTVSTGSWKCVILDSEGKTLKEVGFTVK